MQPDSLGKTKQAGPLVQVRAANVTEDRRRALDAGSTPAGSTILLKIQTIFRIQRRKRDRWNRGLFRSLKRRLTTGLLGGVPAETADLRGRKHRQTTLAKKA